jgi:hypothetical protein
MLAQNSHISSYLTATPTERPPAQPPVVFKRGNSLDYSVIALTQRNRLSVAVRFPFLVITRLTLSLARKQSSINDQVTHA